MAASLIGALARSRTARSLLTLLRVRARSLDSHMAAWLWSVLFAAIFSQPGNNFTGMDFDKIMWRLIPITWTILWSHWFGKRIFGLGG